MELYSSLMKTAISLPNSLFEAADQLAKRRGVSRSELYATAIQEYLCTHRDEGITEALDRIYKEEDSTLDPALAALQIAVLPKDEW
jgi:metal-responsive CopG/Arc/MetJ family transcriptional regulator